MAAYVIAEVEVTEPVEYETYKKGAAASIERYGGRYIARGGATELLEGDIPPQRVVILEFESIERAREWYSSAEYGEAMKIRHRTASSRLVLVDGI